MGDSGQRSVVVIGNFDGVHPGHRRVLEAAHQAEPTLPLIVVTFWPHPLSVLRPGHGPQLLTRLDERIALLKQAGADEVRVIDFTHDFASWTPERFLSDVIRPLHPRRVVVGENFRFGHKAAGNLEALVALARGRFAVTGLPLVKVSDEDLEWLYPGEPVEDVMRRWIKAGPSMVVVTRGPWGAYALLADNRDMLHIDQMNVTVGDTVGAGDSFMAGLIAGLLKSGLLGSVEARQRLADAGWSDVQSALHNAVVTSGITVSKNGAYAPTSDEVEAVKQADPTLY